MKMLDYAERDRQVLIHGYFGLLIRAIKAALPTLSMQASAIESVDDSALARVAAERKLARKRKKQIAEMGEKYLCHPSNRVTKLQFTN